MAEERPSLARPAADGAVPTPASAALREAEARFADLSESMPQLVWMTGRDGRLTWVNQRWIDYVGATIEDSRTTGWAGVFHDDDTRRMHDSWHEAVAAGRPYELEVRIRRGGDGRYRWHLVRGVPRRRAGEVVGWIGVGTDIDELKRAQEDLRDGALRDREREADLRLALEAGEVGTWEVDYAAGEVACDDRCRAVFALPPGARWPRELMLSAIHPDDRPGVEATVQRALDPTSGGRYAQEYRVIGITDGVLRWVRTNGRVTFDPAGRPARFAGMVVDQTEIRRGIERDRLLAEAGAALVSSLDEATLAGALARLCVDRVADWCAIELLRDDGEAEQVAVVHRDPARVALARELHRRYPPAADSPVRRVLAGGEPFFLAGVTDEMIAQGAQDADHAGILRQLGLRSIIVVPVRARERVLGALTLVTAESRRAFGPPDLVVAEDLGRRTAIALENARLFTAEHAARAFAVERAETLSRLNAELEQFAYVASHDLQEPLRMVTQYLDLLERRLGADLEPRERGYLRRAAEGGARMHVLIEDLLQYSRIDRAPPGEAQPVDLARVLAEALENLSASIAQSRGAVTNGPLPRVAGDKIQLTQVLQNLVSNALKFHGDRPPEVRVAAVDRGDAWEISVADNGIGIDPRHRLKVFEVFQRLHTRQQYPGTGIGLSICKKIVERHGGRIWVDAAEGGGSVFRFTLRKAAETPPDA